MDANGQRVFENREYGNGATNADYALVNDSGNNYASLHYYISRDIQLRQLVNSGFQPLASLDSFGRELKENDNDTDSPSIHYLARRPAIQEN